jgi:hypothetical protein
MSMGRGAIAANGNTAQAADDLAGCQSACHTANQAAHFAVTNSPCLTQSVQPILQRSYATLILPQYPPHILMIQHETKSIFWLPFVLYGNPKRDGLLLLYGAPNTTHTT